MALGKKTNISNEDASLRGFNIYHDNKGRPIYRNPLNKTGYVLTGKTKQYKRLSSRYVFGVIAGLLISLFSAPWYVCVIVGVIVWALIEMRFRQFLSRLTQIPNFVPTKEDKTANYDKGEIPSILLKALLMFAIAVVIILIAITEKYTGMYLIGCWIAAIAVAFFGIKELVPLFKLLSK